MRLYRLFPLVLFLMACNNEVSNNNGIASGTASDAKSVEQRIPYGSWPSPISAASLVEGARGLWGLRKDGEFFYWMESRPQEGGRVTVMRWRAGDEPQELLASPWNVRTRVQEYGGGSLLVADGRLWFSNFADQRLYTFVVGEEPVAITPDADLRYAGCSLDRQRQRLLCIREDHRGLEEPVNTLVALPTTPVDDEGHAGDLLFAGTDFVSAPRLSPNGARVAFTTWIHPNMPWDNTQLHSAEFDANGKLVEERIHNPDVQESVIDPKWLDDSSLIALSDRDNWWKPYQVDGTQFSALETGLVDTEIGGPDWSIDSSYYEPLPNGELLLIARKGSVEELYRLDAKGSLARLDTGAVSYGSVVQDGGELFFIAGFADRPSALMKAKLDGTQQELIRATRDSALESTWVPAFEQVSFPLAGGGESHGVYFPPQNPRVSAPEGSAPPLLVFVHGGPTSVAGVSYTPGHYYWTSRGFAILDLNYRGSTGYGREYRRALYTQWGLSDVEDATSGARWLAEQGLADPDRLIIRGGSAGGYTTLAAHAFGETFAAGASYFGVSDIEALAKDTHKFESRYLDQLIGPYPERQDLYVERSPFHHLEGFNAPLLLLQGLDDPIVPPNQSEAIYAALKSRGVATAYIAFEGEAHGFRKAENQIAARQAELYFYAKVLGFELAEALPPVPIDNLPASDGASD